MEKKPTILTLVRHGETSANVSAVWHGSTDTALSDRGHRQAEEVAAALRRRVDVTAVYASDLQRTLSTAKAIARVYSVEVRPDAALREYGLGAWEGRTFADLEEAHGIWHRMREDPDWAPHGGDSPRRVTTRVVDALQRIAASHRGERVVVVGHGGATDLALGYLLKGHYRGLDRILPNCGVAELELEPVPTLLSIDEFSRTP